MRFLLKRQIFDLYLTGFFLKIQIKYVIGSELEGNQKKI